MEETPSIDIEDLYETKQKMDVNRLNIYNKLLARVHNRIKLHHVKERIINFAGLLCQSSL